MRLPETEASALRQVAESREISVSELVRKILRRITGRPFP